MKILYDYKAFKQHIGGVSRTFAELINHLPKETEAEVAVKYSRNVYLKEILPGTKYLLGNIHFPRKRRLIEKINLRYFQNRLKKKDYDLLHCTTDDCMFQYLDTNIPFVATIHDTIAELYINDCEINASGFIDKYWLMVRAETINKANHIICVSENTKKDLLHFYPQISEEKVSVIHHGIQYNINPYGDYILYVGGRRVYKNFDLFAKSIAPILKSKKLKLICTGVPFSDEEKKTLNDLGILSQTLQMFVDEQTLNSLYYYAKLFVFPSIYEGFGMPLLEAMANRCPMAISRTSCFPEIAGDAAAYFEPASEKNMYNIILQLLENNNERKVLIEKGCERVKQFSWNTAAQKLVDVYKNIM